MENSRKQEFIADFSNQSNAEDFEDSSSTDALSLSGVDMVNVRSGEVSRAESGSRSEIGLTERLTDILVDEGDGDLLLQPDVREDRVLQWLQALDMQVMGACRADERLKPLLKVNVSSGIAEDHLLSHLTQHFEPSEVGMLARCFCIPLVSIRVGKINKQGPLLSPTATRGNLNLILLPVSDLRLSFIGDDGNTEKLFTLSNKSQCSAVEIEEIPADNSGRSFHIKIFDGRVFYFWCAEKSKLLGTELLSKMKDLLKRKPSIGELTGISESRLGCFATHLRAYLVGSAVSNTPLSSAGFPVPSLNTSVDLPDTTQNAQNSSGSSKSLRSRHFGSQTAKANSIYQGSLSPRSSSFKEGMPKTLSSLRTAAREKLKRRGDHLSVAVDNLSVASPLTTESSSSGHSEIDKLPEVSKSCPFFLESLGELALPPTQASLVPSIGSPFFSPHYCWCPQGAPMPQFSAAALELPKALVESPSYMPVSSFTGSSGLLTPNLPISLSDIPSLDFPALLPDPLLRLPMPSSQQIPTFTPLMCDPIVHIPVIDVCSSGQGYLVSAGPAIATTIPPLHPKLVNPLISESESMLEKGARETLRLLIGSSNQTKPQLMNVLPAVLTSADEKQNLLVGGSRGLYCGVRDVAVITNSIATMGLVSLAGSSLEERVVKTCGSSDNLVTQPEASSSGSSCSEDGTNLKEWAD